MKPDHGWPTPATTPHQRRRFSDYNALDFFGYKMLDFGYKKNYYGYISNKPQIADEPERMIKMNVNENYIKELNREFALNLTGLSPLHGAKKIPESAVRLIVKDFGNGLGRVLYVDQQNRLIANNMEQLKNEQIAND